MEAFSGTGLAYTVLLFVRVSVSVYVSEYNVANFVRVDRAVVVGQVLLLVGMGLPELKAVPEDV